MITCWQIMNAWSAALRTDVALSAWCLERYAKGLSLQLGYNPRKLPPKEFAPGVVLSPLGRETGFEQADWAYGVRVSCILYDDTIQETDGLTSFVGQGYLEDEFSPRVQDVLRTALAQVVPSIIESELFLEAFPFLELHMAITATLPNRIGRSTL